MFVFRLEVLLRTPRPRRISAWDATNAPSYSTSKGRRSTLAVMDAGAREGITQLKLLLDYARSARIPRRSRKAKQGSPSSSSSAFEVELQRHLLLHKTTEVANVNTVLIQMLSPTLLLLTCMSTKPVEARKNRSTNKQERKSALGN